MKLNEIELVVRLASHGLTAEQVRVLLRAERMLNRWDCALCNGEIQETDAGDIVDRNGRKVRNRFKTIWASAEKVIANTGFKLRHQGDPRGCSLYLLTQAQPAVYGDGGGIALCA